MNTPESESSPPGVSGLQVELGASAPRRPRLFWLLPLLAFLALGSVTLVAWLPNSSPAPSLSPTTEFQGTSSTVPPLTWSPTSIEVILSPGENSSREITFTSSQSLKNVTIVPVPAIAPFLTITPNTFAQVQANTTQTVRVMFAIASGTTLGMYQGTIQLRVGAKTLPQTLKLTITTPTAMDLYRNSTPPRIVHSLTVFPRSLTAGESTLLTIIADIGDGDDGNGRTIVSESVSLFRYSDTDQLIARYGRMYDDGTHGDLKPNDGRYVLQISVLDSAPLSSYFTVAVSYVGVSTPVFAQPVYVTTFAAVAGPDQVLQIIAGALEVNDMATVRRHTYANQQNIEALELLTSDQELRLGLADILRNAQLSTNDGTYATFLSDGDPIRLARTNDGVWILVSW